MPYQRSVPKYLLLVLSVVLALPACVPAATQAPQMPPAPVTPTPEVFNPLNPSPTTSGSTLPMTCQITDLKVYIDEVWGYCFAYPAEYTLDESQESVGTISLYGPALDENADPLRVSLEVTAQPVPAESDLARLVDAYLTQFQDVPVTITREPWLLGNLPAEKLDPVPGLLSSRLVMALHDELLFTLRFHPSDIDYARPSLDDLTQTVTSSFAFLEGSQPPVPQEQTIIWNEFGKQISFTYDPTLAPWVEARTAPEVPASDRVLFSESHPAFAPFRFTGYQGGQPYQLPLLSLEDNIPQVMVFRSVDFPGFGDDTPTGFANQLQVLQDLLETGVDSALCAQPTSGEFALPFLPWVNSRQTFCSQPEMIEFPGGRGVRYLTYYSQDPSPVMDQNVFYTFQGLTDDGQFYISAVFPVATGIFPTEPQPCPRCSEPDYNPIPEWQALLAEQLVQLNAQGADEFTPSLATLDELVRSIQIAE